MRKVALIILDGFGIGKPDKNNAIYVARTPFFDELWNSCPHTKLEASGLAVGLPAGQIGGSEVGHLTIGAGRVLYQDLVRIDRAFAEPDNEEYGIKHNKTFIAFLEKAKEKSAHLLGLLSPGGIHSYDTHLHTIIRIMHDYGCKEPFIHVISDGRDTLPQSGVGYGSTLQKLIDELQFGKIVGVTGRFYAMDRDKNLDRTQQFFDLIVKAKALKNAATLEDAFRNNYKEKLTDELQVSTLIEANYKGLHEGEPVLFFNFRSDRMKQIATMLHEAFPANPFYTMTQYDKSYPYPVFFKKQILTNTLSEIISNHSIQQLKAAETDKIPHVTYFFNGGVEVVFPGETHAFVASTKVTYDKSPEMRAKEITDNVQSALTNRPDTGFAVVNFANADLVSHFGNFDSSVKAVETVDRELKRLCEYLVDKDYICIITADHGNADEMFDEATGQPRTAHTMNPVPFIVYDPKKQYPESFVLNQSSGLGLSHVAATVLQLMDLPIPQEFDKSLML